MPHYMENNLVNGFDTKKTITQKRVALLSNDPFDINCDTLIQVKDIDEQSGREGSRVFFREKTLSNNILIPNVVINNAQEIQSTSPRGIISATINIDRNFIVQNKFQGFSNTQKLISNESRENDQIYYLGPKSISAMKEKKISNKSVISDHKSSNFHNLGVLTNNQENKIEHSYTIKDQKSKYRISIMSYKNSNLAQNNKNFLTTEHNLKSQFKRYSVQTQKRGRKNSMYSQQRKSKRIKQVIQTKLAQNKNNHYVPFMSKDDYKSQLDETTKQKLLVIELFQMGFFDEAVERAIHYTGAKTIEDCLPFLILNEKNVMDHQFVSVNNAAYGSQYEEYKNIHPQSQHCFLCLKNRKKQTKKTLKQINERLLTRQTSRKSRRDSQNDAVPSDEELEQQICVFPNRVLVSNKKYMQIQEERGVILNTYEGGIVLTNQDRNKSALSMVTNQNQQRTEMVPPMRLNLEDSKSFQNEDNVQDIEATRRNFLDQTNQDLTAFDINRLNKNIISNNINVLTNSNNQVTYLNGGGQESPKFKQIYQYFEPKKNLSPEVDNYMKEKQGIDIKLETEGNLNVILHKVNPHHRKSNKNIKDETINKVLFTNYQDQKSEFSRTKTDVNKKFNEGILKVNTFRSINPSVLNSNSLGINGGMSSSKKDSSKDNDVMYSFRSMTSRHATEDERCLVCQLPLDYHNPDFNQDLLSVQLRFNEQTIFKETENRIMSNQSFQSSLPNQNENENDNENENSIEGQEDFATLVDRGIRNRTQLAIPNQINLKTQSNYLSPMSIADQLENTNDLDKQKMRALKFRQEIVERRIRSQEQFIDSNRSLVSNPKCSICMDPKFFPQQSGENESVVLDQLQSLEGRNMIQLDQCNHIYCVQCFKDYLKYQINNGLVLDIKCCECKIKIPDSLISQLFKDDEKIYSKLKRFRKNIELALTPKTCYCPNPRCSMPLQLKSPDFCVSCPYCYLEFCLLTKQQWHKDLSCKDHLEQLYKKAARGKSIQMCPYCNKIVEKAKSCNHLTCTFCMISFCLFCRDKYQQNHITPYHAFICAASQNPKKSPSIDTSVAKFKLISIILSAILFVFLAPILALIFSPLVTTKNAIEFSERPSYKSVDLRFKLKNRRRIKLLIYGFLISIIATICLPITLSLLGVIGITSLYQLRKRKRIAFL